jgi:DNA-binding HxlR family transcriptional regulator
MKKQKFNCPGEMTVSLIDGKWKTIILWLLRKGPQRSGKLKSRMPGITSASFSNAVRELESTGLISRQIKSTLPLEVSYNLTEKGETLKPIVKSLVKWGLENQKEYLLGEFGMARFY